MNMATMRDFVSISGKLQVLDVCIAENYTQNCAILLLIYYNKICARSNYRRNI